MHYLRTSRLLDCSIPLDVGPARIRLYSDGDAQALTQRLRKRTPFSRYRGDRDFYTSRGMEFANQTVVEFTLLSGTAEEVRAMAERAERLAFVAASLWMGRDQLHRLMQIGGHSSGAIDLVVHDRNHLSSTSRRPSSPRGLVVDAIFVKRFLKYGFSKTADTIVRSQGYASTRVNAALRWLSEARLEHDDEAAYVKTVIGLETLFVLNQREPLRQTIADRVAFLLGRDPGQRAVIAQVVKKVYDRRSDIVHGGRGGTKTQTELLELTARILVLASVGLAFQTAQLQSTEDLRRWFDDLKWSVRSQVPPLPFPPGVLTRLLASTAAR